MRRNAIILCSLLLVALAYALLSVPNGVAVLNYHQVNGGPRDYLTVSTEDFAAQLNYLHEQGYTAITADALAAHLRDGAALPPKPVLITFDDGYADNYACAYPVLRQRHLPALVFVISDYIGKYKNYLTWEQVREMAAGDVAIGSHTLSHESLPALPTEDAKRQLADSKLAIEWWTGQPVRYMAYPCGDYDAAVAAEVKACGYAAAFTIDLGYVTPHDDPYTLHRVPIFGDIAHQPWRFAARLRCPRLVAAIAHSRRWLADHDLRSLASLLPYI